IGVMTACLAAALFAYVFVSGPAERARIGAAAGFGLALGLAVLAQYAALLALVGLAIHLAVSKAARDAWTVRLALLAAAVFALVVGPSLAWTFIHGYGVFAEAGERSDAAFAIYLALFGPLALGVACVGAIWMAARRALTGAEGLLVVWAAPALALPPILTTLGAASAGWTAALFPPAAILVAALMLGWKRPRLLAALLTLHGLAAAAVLTAALKPDLAVKAGLADVLAPVRAGRAASELVVDQARAAQFSGPLGAVVVDEPDLRALVAYNGRDYFGKGGPAVTANARTGARVLVVHRDGSGSLQALRARFANAGETDIGEVWLDPRHTLRIESFVGVAMGAAAPRR
ncbi:MAG: hypothetical protein ACREEQ_02285, partial [Caulobacteraceae bacterium]